MIALIDLEHERLRQEPDLWRFFATKTLEAKYRLEAISGGPCLIVHYDRATPEHMRALGVKAIIVAGHYTGLWHYAGGLDGLRQIFRQATWPTLGFCGGFQLLAQTYGAELVPMHIPEEVMPGENPDTPLPPGLMGPDSEGVEGVGYYERGFTAVRILEPDPLFADLEIQVNVFELHSWKVQSPPRGFRLLAGSRDCEVQAIGLVGAQVYGVQFHPELFDESHPDGLQILRNFFKLAGIRS